MVMSLEEVRDWLFEISRRFEALGVATKTHTCEVQTGQDPCVACDLECADGGELFVSIWSIGRYEVYLVNPNVERDRQLAFETGGSDSAKDLIEALSPWVERFQCLIGP